MALFLRTWENLYNSNGEKLLCIKIDTKLSFENHVWSFCKKASQKLHELARIVNYMNLSKRKSLMKAFVTSQFNYCLLIWMFHSRELNNRVNRIHERVLRLEYQDNNFVIGRTPWKWQFCDNTSKKSTRTCYGNF